MIEKVRIGYSPLSKTLYLYRHGKNPAVALEKREAEHDVMAALVQYLTDDSPKGSEMEFTLGDRRYRVRVEPVATPEGEQADD